MNIENAILFENNHLIAVNKEPGVLSQDDGSTRPVISDLVKEYIKIRDNKPGNVFIGIVHRLDFPVSGALLLAKTSKGASRISAQIRDHSFRKIYLALCSCSASSSMSTEWSRHEAFLERRGDKTFVVQNKNKGQKAILKLKTLASNKDYCLNAVELVTGRKHQIRCQLASLGMPIAGDTKYGSKTAVERRILLHCSFLSFKHPTADELIQVHAPLPEIFSFFLPEAQEITKAEFQKY